MSGPIASAVVLPEPQELDPPPPQTASPTSQKRRQSSLSGQDVKLPRLHGNDSTADRRNSVDAKSSAPAPPRRERGRERRLFGAALGALSQNSATTAQKRRLEIEQRQQAQRKQQYEETIQRKIEREDQRKAQRWREQKRFERLSMKIRHENLLHMAHFLHTETKPRLYYKPWETTPAEDDRLRDQIAEAQATIQRELDEGLTQRGEGRERRDSQDRHAAGGAEGSYTGKEYNAEAIKHPPAANRHTNDSGTPSVSPESKDAHAGDFVNEAVSEVHAVEPQDQSTAIDQITTDVNNKEPGEENGEELLEATEDTVIY